MTAAAEGSGWRCPACGGSRGRPAWTVPSDRSEDGVSAEAFRPSSERFGETTGRVVRCERCGHGSVLEAPGAAAVHQAYAEAVDPVSLREEAGQIATAHRGLAALERVVRPGRLLDVGCWTGSFLDAARARGWEAAGVEPSRWAAARAAERGLDVQVADFDDADLAPASFRAVVLCDVIEHLADPGAAIDRAAGLLEPGGALFLTTPDAGSRLARMLGRRWWSVLPMHLQYFTRRSMSELLGRHGFRVASVATHPKTFTARYYAERLAGYSSAIERAAVGGLGGLRLTNRPVSPDFRDRMLVIAVRGDDATP